MDMKRSPTPGEIYELFNNNDPEDVWAKVTEIICRINPAYDFSLVHSVFDDVMRLFRGEYPGYAVIKTPYHDLAHTLEVLTCGARLIHGVHVSGDPISDDEITQVILAILLHDVGYAQHVDEDNGTGAQFTLTHVRRGIDFMHEYFVEHNLRAETEANVGDMILSTEHAQPFEQIHFLNERTHMLGRIVATADLAGQMADRIYLEKLLFLFLEFKEAHFGSYQSMFDLLRNTNSFYEMTRKKLDGSLGGIFHKLEFHFRETMGVNQNFYLVAIEKNMAYLAKVVQRSEGELSAMLKRNGVVEKSLTLSQSV